MLLCVCHVGAAVCPSVYLLLCGRQSQDKSSGVMMACCAVRRLVPWSGWLPVSQACQAATATRGAAAASRREGAYTRMCCVITELPTNLPSNNEATRHALWEFFSHHLLCVSTYPPLPPPRAMQCNQLTNQGVVSSTPPVCSKCLWWRWW